MKRAIGLAVAFGLMIVAPAAEATETQPAHHHHRRHHATPVVEQSAPVSHPNEPAGAPIKPYAHPGDGNNDGLSRDPDDCNKGCIGGNPG